MKIKIDTINTNKNTKSVKKWIIVISSVFVLLSYSQVVIAADITAQKMIELTNESREKSGLLPLKVNSKLMVAAEAKVNDMFEFQYFDHNSPSGVTPWYWIRSAGYDYLYAGENLAIDFVTAEGSHLALMRSITHRDNILKPNYTEVGIAVKKGIFDGNESIIIVEEFGAPLEIKKVVLAEENKSTEINIKGDVDVNSVEKKLEIKTEEIKVVEPKKELVEIKSPIVYFKDENYEKDVIEDIADKGNKTDNETDKTNEKKEVEVAIEKIDEELVLPIMFPIENIESLDKTFTEDIFWNNYKEEKEEKTFEKIISFFNYKFWLVKMCVVV